MQSQSMDQPTALLITGTVGAGKTTIAAAAGSILAGARTPHAIIDLDALSQSWPNPPDDPFNLAMELQNLESVARNYLSAGAHDFEIMTGGRTLTDVAAAVLARAGWI